MCNLQIRTYFTKNGNSIGSKRAIDLKLGPMIDADESYRVSENHMTDKN